MSGLKLDEKSIENGLEGQKFLVVCLFWGGCHHPNELSAMGGGAMTTFGDLRSYVNGFTCSPHEIQSPKVFISPQNSIKI